MTALYGKATEKQLRAFEGYLNEPLPKEYRAFLKTYNGLKFEDFIPCTPKHDPKIDVDVKVIAFYGMSSDSVEYGEGERYHLPDKQHDYDFNSRVPENIICIAQADYLFKICLSLSGKDQGKVYLWVPYEDWVEDDVVPSYEELKLLFDSFDELLEALRIGRSN